MGRNMSTVMDMRGETCDYRTFHEGKEGVQRPLAGGDESPTAGDQQRRSGTRVQPARVRPAGAASDCMEVAQRRGHSHAGQTAGTGEVAETGSPSPALWRPCA